MSSWVKYLVIVTFSAFFAIVIWGVLSLNWGLVRGGGVVALLISPLLLEAFFPGRYVLRSPPEGEGGGIMWSLKQFVQEHPGWDGKFLALTYSAIVFASLTGGIYAILRGL